MSSPFSTVESLKLDIDELEAFLKQSQRENVKLNLTRVIANLEMEEKILAQSSAAGPAGTAADPVTASTTTSTSSGAPADSAAISRPQAETEKGKRKAQGPYFLKAHALQSPYFMTEGPYFTTIKKFSWDQSGDKVKVYLDLPGVGALDPSCVSVEFADRSCELKVRNLEGRNFAFAVKKLGGQIDAKGSCHKVKKDSVVLHMKKSGMAFWTDLTEKGAFKTVEGAFKQAEYSGEKDSETEMDPSASLMKMMKELYDQGDDDMKRTIAKAWDESRQKGGRGFASMGTPEF
uniref:Calcyclin-binding protein n=1 Tax=Chromera velia CCMP2878 TaxID=1169474 RepID=A0A0G4FVV9_9ALVE|eukprot:Cvel_488.t1-p1 / transcript=Cvel_488.t1 / gene=Cvel_488 / organism=Chromera_velia_CCMP2878 / gene_product=Calcyclin-binding protein, putative / transcript_product=Calcyclin-binding protein, putative / location=Cvel_scaffold15:117088-121363(-) / protein_length=289 / sequence_SO=supercontig / SO=protein_coding / is_pseudo=false